jgi:hypothetical protein
MYYVWWPNNDSLRKKNDKMSQTGSNKAVIK